MPIGLFLPGAVQTAFDAATIERRADQWINPYVAAGDFSGVVLIAQGDQTLVGRAYGKADFQHNVAIQIGTRFRIASLSKTFTAAAIELLKAQGKLAPKDQLSKYVSGMPNGEKITPNAKGNVPGAKAGSVVPLSFEEAAIIGPGSLYSTAHDLYAWLRAVDANLTFQVQHLEISLRLGSA